MEHHPLPLSGLVESFHCCSHPWWQREDHCGDLEPDQQERDEPVSICHCSLVLPPWGCWIWKHSHSHIKLTTKAAIEWVSRAIPSPQSSMVAEGERVDRSGTVREGRPMEGDATIDIECTWSLSTD